MDIIERDIFAAICGSDGIKASKIARKLNQDRSVINHYLYASPYMHELSGQILQLARIYQADEASQRA